MGNSLFLSLSYYSIPVPIKRLLTSALLKEAKKNKLSELIVLIDTEPNEELKTFPSKLGKDHPLFRYSSTLPDVDIPFINRENFLHLCSEMEHPKNKQVFEKTVAIVMHSKPPADQQVTALDGICIVTPVDMAIIPLIYQTILSMHSLSKIVPIFLWIFGESKIEIGAEFFLQIKHELDELAREAIDLYYLGCIQIPREELLLLSRFKKDIHSAFPESSLLGSVKYACDRLFIFPEMQDRFLSGQILRGLL